MATFEPPLDLFERQVTSIREQTYDNWICLISDDCSSPQRLAGIREVLGDDPRFLLFPSRRRRGFYGNFERALAMVPREASYVALADQDDRWYPDKLEVLAGVLGSGATLAYSDTRIADSSGTVIFDTYWRYRRNNLDDFTSLLMTNAITGAASLFRRDLLDSALPFPPPQGEAYHDHWIALVAMASGEVGYVDRPLYDYVQHSEAALGYTKANANRGKWGGPLADLAMRALRIGWRLVRPVGEARYFDVYCRMAVQARTLELRCGEQMSPKNRRAIRRVLSCDRSVAGAVWLALRALRTLAGRNRTMGMERSLVAGIAWHRMAGWRMRLARARRMA
jgi:glycosyltransferase involved in cell wall biosynthesis